MRKVFYIILLVLTFLSIIILLIKFLSKPLSNVLGLTPRAGIRIEASDKSRVLINENVMGETPFQDETLTEGEYLVELLAKDSTASASVWKGYVKLNGGTLTIVNREVNKEKNGSAGEIINLEKGKGVSIITTPPNASVIIDGKNIGRTPVTVSDLSSGEHQFIISKDNYLDRSIRAALIDGYNLTITADLSITEADLTKLQTTPITQTPQVIIKATPTGFLRVRSSASTSSTEIGRLSPGDTVTLLEELSGWYRIKMPDGKEGYISSSYAEKKTN